MAGPKKRSKTKTRSLVQTVEEKAVRDALRERPLRSAPARPRRRDEPPENWRAAFDDAVLAILSEAWRTEHGPEQSPDRMDAVTDMFSEVTEVYARFKDAVLTTTKTKPRADAPHRGAAPVTASQPTKPKSYNVSSSTPMLLQLRDSIAGVFQGITKRRTSAKAAHDLVRHLLAESGLIFRDDALNAVDSKWITNCGTGKNGGPKRAASMFLVANGVEGAAYATLNEVLKHLKKHPELGGPDLYDGQFRVTREPLEFLLEQIGYSSKAAQWIAEQLVCGKRRIVTPSPVQAAVDQLAGTATGALDRGQVRTADRRDHQRDSDRTPRIIFNCDWPLLPFIAWRPDGGPWELAATTERCVVVTFGPPLSGASTLLKRVAEPGRPAIACIDASGLTVEEINARVESEFERAEVVALDNAVSTADDICALGMLKALGDLARPWKPIRRIGFARLWMPRCELLDRARELGRLDVTEARLDLEDGRLKAIEETILGVGLPYTIIPTSKLDASTRLLSLFAGVSDDPVRAAQDPELSERLGLRSRGTRANSQAAAALNFGGPNVRQPDGQEE